jgi:hypothetical protein
MKRFSQLLFIPYFISFALTACQQSGVSGKYICLNPNENGINVNVDKETNNVNKVAEELVLDFISDDKVKISVSYKRNGVKSPDFPDILARDNRYIIEDKKVVILNASFGMVSASNETFLIKGSELVHYSGMFFKGKECRKS